jgi:hypothetical protein
MRPMQPSFHPTSVTALLALALALALADTTACSQEPGGDGDALRLRRLSVTDPMMGGEEAFSMLVPADWRVEGGIVWRPELATLAYAAMRISNPQGPEMLEVFPNIPFTWNERGYMGFPPGSLYLGMYVQQPIWDAQQYVQSVTLPQFRQGVNARIVDRQELPDVARLTAAAVQEPGAQKRVVAERVRIEYAEGGRQIEEDIYCVLVFTQVPTMPGLTMWGTDRIFSFRAEKGKLDEQAPLLHAMVFSVRINPSWFNKYLQVQQMWIQNQMQAIRSAGELSRYLSRTSAEISDMNMRAWEERQASQDRLSREFSEYIRGVETYVDPLAGHDVQLPSAYAEAWVSSNGEYILSNNPNFNPNVGSNQSWERMRARN